MIASAPTFGHVGQAWAGFPIPVSRKLQVRRAPKGVTKPAAVLTRQGMVILAPKEKEKEPEWAKVLRETLKTGLKTYIAPPAGTPTMQQKMREEEEMRRRMEEERRRRERERPGIPWYGWAGGALVLFLGFLMLTRRRG